MDLGYGTLSPLLQLLGSSFADGVDALIVTHHHPDHMLDVHGLFRARWFGRRSATTIPLFCPRSVVDRLKGLEDDDADAIEHVFAWRPLPAQAYEVGPFRLESMPLPHFVPNAGVRLTAPGLTVSYTGDTGPDPALADLGREADLFIAESSDRFQSGEYQPKHPKMHLSARQAGEAAAAGNARRLLLSHFWPNNDRESSRDAASRVYNGEVILAEEGMELPLP